MRFLLDADLPNSSTEVVRGRGHEAVNARRIGLHNAPDPQIALYAQTEKLCLITGDFGFADLRNYPPSQYFGIVILSLPGNANAVYINHLLEYFLDQVELLAQIPGKLAIVEAGRVRLRENLT